MATKKRTKRSCENQSVAPVERIERSIYVIRGRRVMLDEDLAELYGTSTKRLNEQVSRNQDRFPEDFAFRLSPQEYADLRSQIATARWTKRRYPPRAFTEHGAVMAASVLNSPVAVEMSVEVVRGFVRMRELVLTHADLAQKLADLEKTVDQHDVEIRTVFEAIRQLIEPPEKESEERRIGFQAD